MLTRIFLDNFRCFVNFEYRPERKQLLLGPNGSGKSPLLKAISYLKQFINGDENPFTETSRTRWQDRAALVFEVEALLDGQKYEYRLQLETKHMSVVQEQLKVAEATIFNLDTGVLHFLPTHNGSKTTLLSIETDRSMLHLWQLSNPQVGRFIGWMKSVRCFQIDQHHSARDASADREKQVPDDELANFAEWYRFLVQSYPDENVKYLTSLRESLTGFQTLRFSSDEDRTRMLRADFAGPKGKMTFGLSELSEGQWCLLCLYAILHFLIMRGDTVFIDEPDNFIALREIQPWLLAAEEAVEDHHGQLILISHHPEILNQWASAYGLQFFREENGQVRTRKFKVDPEGGLQPSELIARGWDDE